jgi:hypothetical protein
MSAFLPAARDYAGRGAPVFPCEPLGKAPLTAHGFHDATTDAETIREWWSRWPSANVAMPTGRQTFDVLDVDVRPAGDGWAAYDRLRRAGLLAGAARMVRTPSTGLHLYFPPAGQASSRLPGHYLDLKADGGYVLLPPSYVRTTDYSGTYEEIDARDTGRALDWQACRRLLDPPEWKPYATRTARRGSAIDGLADWLSKQPEGNRNNGLYWAARRALEEGLDPSALIGVAEQAGLPRFEAERTVASARRAACG